MRTINGKLAIITIFFLLLGFFAVKFNEKIQPVVANYATTTSKTASVSKVLDVPSDIKKIADKKYLLKKLSLFQLCMAQSRRMRL